MPGFSFFCYCWTSYGHQNFCLTVEMDNATTFYQLLDYRHVDYRTGEWWNYWTIGYDIQNWNYRTIGYRELKKPSVDYPSKHLSSIVFYFTSSLLPLFPHFLKPVCTLRVEQFCLLFPEILPIGSFPSFQTLKINVFFWSMLQYWSLLFLSNLLRRKKYPSINNFSRYIVTLPFPRT